MLPDSIFGLQIRHAEAYEFTGLPLLYRSSYEGFFARIGNTPCIVVTPKDQLRPLQAHKLCQLVYERESLPCIVHAEDATAYQRRAMTERGIAWIMSKNTFSIPFLATSCDAHELRKKNAAPLSANAQRVAVAAIGGTLVGMTTTEVAHQLGVSLSSAANYLSELQAACPGLVGTRGRARFLQLPKDMTKETLYDALRPYMSSPVRERLFVKVADSDIRTLEALPLSGVSALSLRTDIADDPWRTHALYGRKANEALSGSIVVGEYDQPDALIEVWRYEPMGGSEAVDDVSLLLDLEEWADTGDERLEEAMSLLRKEAFS